MKHAEKISPPQELNKRSRGFSLIETAIALGVIAFSLTALVGMLPVGLNIHKNSMNLSVGSRITQSIEGEIRRGETPLTSGLRHFDQDGNELNAQNELAIYTVNVIQNPVFPLPSDTAGGSRNLSRVVVEVVRNPAQTPLALDGQGRVTGAGNLDLRTFGFHVAP
jgi:uncharacterized protein (TIGR02598 family)